MKQKTIVLALLLASSISLFSQELDTTKLNLYFKALEANNKMMGSVALARNGEIIYTNTIGYSNLESLQKADEETAYGIGSVSKTFTSAMMLIAVDEGKIQLDDKISQYFPSIVNAGKITIRQLLQHKSGIPNFTNDSTYYYWYEETKTRQEMVDFIANLGSDFIPDSSWAYSNSNYVLLSYILEDIYNTSFAKVLKKKITKPLKLSHTYLHGSKKKVENESNSYQFMGDWEKAGITHSSITMGAGGIFSTPSDLVKFNYALFTGKVLSKSSLDEMTSMESNLGLGIFAIPFNHLKGYGHTGGVDGYSSVFVFFPEDSLSYAFISNGVNYLVNDISIAVLSAAYDMAYHVPAIRKYDIPKGELQKYVGEYTSTEIPLVISVTVEDEVLKAQAKGQSPFPLTAKDKDVFGFAPAGVEMVFNTENHTLVLKQAGQEYLFLMQ